MRTPGRSCQMGAMTSAMVYMRTLSSGLGVMVETRPVSEMSRTVVKASRVMAKTSQKAAFARFWGFLSNSSGVSQYSVVNTVPTVAYSSR